MGWFGKGLKTSAMDMWDPEGDPYSQVNLVRQIRILGEEVTREFFVVYAEINPGTYTVLSRYAGELNDPDVSEFLDCAVLRVDRMGYDWCIYEKEAINEKEAQTAVRKLRQTMIRLHIIVMKLLAEDTQ